VYDFGAPNDQGGAGKRANPLYPPLDPIPHHERKITGSIRTVNGRGTVSGNGWSQSPQR
jgi:hypothetical protein